MPMIRGVAAVPVPRCTQGTPRREGLGLARQERARGGRCGFNSESVAGAEPARHDQARRIRSVGGSPRCRELGLAPLIAGCISRPLRVCVCMGGGLWGGR